jgi:hypothetical protein
VGVRDGIHSSQLKTPKLRANLGVGILDTSGRSLMVVLEEELLVELALWWWVVIVFWATQPNYG